MSFDVVYLGTVKLAMTST